MKTEAIIGIIIAAVVGISIPTANALETSANGFRDGKMQGHSDAVNGYPADDSCGSSHSNDYCTAYKIGYNYCTSYYYFSMVPIEKCIG